MTYTKNKKGFLSTVTSLLLIALLVMLLYGGSLYLSSLSPPEEITTEQLTTEVDSFTDIEPILLATKDKMIQANVFIQTIFDNQIELGSGTIINEDDSYYYIITNYHVIDGNGNVIDSSTIQTYDGVSSNYELLKSDEVQDLAYLRISKSNRNEITPLTLVYFDTQELDHIALCVGNPFGNLSLVNFGTITRETYIQELEISHQVLEHSINLGEGSSGGALCNAYGQLLGINTWTKEGLFYAIPSSVINTFLETN